MGYIYSIANAKRGFDVEMDSRKPENISLKDAIMYKGIYNKLIENGFQEKDIIRQRVFPRISLNNPKKITVVTYAKTDIFPEDDRIERLLNPR